MKATDMLMEEHRLIERFIVVLEATCDQLETGQEVSPDTFIDAVDFIEGLAERCHNQKEENILFKAMAESGFPIQSGPIAVMLYEHKQGRAFKEEIRQALQRLSAGDSSALNTVIENARGYATLLRQHIMKEDQVLFPVANQIIPLECHAEIADYFERFDHDDIGERVQEKYQALVERLEKEVVQAR